MLFHLKSIKKMNLSRGITSMIRKLNVVKEKLFSTENLLYTNVTISISLSAFGDILEQNYEILKGELNGWNSRRTKHMAISGTSVGILCHYWYRYLDARFPGRSIGVVSKKVLFDQLFFSPIYIGIFFLTVGVLENKNWMEIGGEVRDKAHKLYVAEWIVWPPAQIINFYFLPTRFRILYDNTISLGYDFYTSHVKYNRS